ncbi:hypothetical protein [Pseudofrankia asymbiotica]|uniref:hypothetical protein n=1 Tax=Pseudofrankia asymbiotica TaxID=1834516 RepID=UPI0010565356|nr:hypothetical protein [Pseudofrankia asymbiotica]
MSSVPPSGGSAWRNPPRAYVASIGDRHHLTVLPGADPGDVRAAVAALQPGSYLTSRRSPRDRDGVVLVFRSWPDGDAPVDADAPTTPAGGWTPEVAAPVAEVPPDLLRTVRVRHDRAPVPAWWTTVFSTIVGGPWADRHDATKAGADDPDARAVYGCAQPDGTVAARPAPDQLSWERHLCTHLDRLRDDDGGPVRSLRDDVAMLALQVAGALVAAGLPLAETGGAEPHGGALVVPARHATPAGVAIGWATHPHLPALGVHSEATAATLPDVMGYALASLLGTLGFRIQRGAGTHAHLVTAAPTT